MDEYGIFLEQLGNRLFLEWVTFFDPDGGPDDVEYPTGIVVTSADASKALRFASMEEATAFWRQQSTRTPLRPDGKPNRPLTAYTVTIRKIEEE